MRGTIKPSAPVDFDEFATEAEISVNVANNLGPSVAVLGLTPQQILAASVNHSVPFEL